MTPEMMKRFKYSNAAAVPRVLKTVINVGIGKIITLNPTTKDKLLKDIEGDIALITGQKPKVILSRRSIASFKLREGMAVGLMVTLRGKRMFDFLSRLINIAIPRTRDFRGIPEHSFDKDGNLNIGVREHIVFPEAMTEFKKTSFGFEITVVTNAKSKEESKEFLRLMGFPLKV